jgi:hypothetical protein
MNPMVRIYSFILVLTGFCLVAPVLGMDRWAALSMLESGNDDCATGRGGEVSRFQIRPQLWPGGDPRDAKTALAVAENIMRAREAAFERVHHRAPTDFEFYVLWNAPAEVNHPHRRVAARAKRFVNLVLRDEPRTQTLAFQRSTPGVR